ncbi:MAG: nucleotide pyrophosphohydrolase [Bacteroidota bacterium]
MTINEWQAKVDTWIRSYGVRYFDEMTNTLVLTEEVGEFARLIARHYGEQSFKNANDAERAPELIREELADIFFVLTCLANQMGIDITEILERNLLKKTTRDATRHLDNTKLHPEE